MNKVFILIVFLLFVADCAFANIRASRHRPIPEGQHPKPNGTSITVESEDLLVHCDFDICRFAVTYRLRNPAVESIRIDTTFVAPVRGVIKLICPQAVTTLSELRPIEVIAATPHRVNSDEEHPELSEATVVCDLPNGDTSIEIRYEQLTGYREEGVGYFSSSWFRRFFLYELAPLKEWQLGDQFKLNLEFTVPDKPIGFFRSLLSLDPVMLCIGDNKELMAVERETKAGGVTFRYLFGVNFPNRLRCEYQVDDD